MEKELALFDLYKKAPKEVQDLGAAHTENFVELEKARAQVKLWEKELIKAEAEYLASGKLFKVALQAWKVVEEELVKEEKPIK